MNSKYLFHFIIKTWNKNVKTNSNNTENQLNQKHFLQILPRINKTRPFWPDYYPISQYIAVHCFLR